MVGGYRVEERWFLAIGMEEDGWIGAVRVDFLLVESVGAVGLGLR